MYSFYILAPNFKRMKRLILAVSLILGACTSAQINQAIGDVNKSVGGGSVQPTTAEVGDGLKEALIKGISNGADIVSRTDGYFKNPSIKIPFPPDVKRVEDKLRQIGLGDQVDNFVMTMNRGAEDAAKEAKPIFIAAIRSMTIQDAWSILRGQDDAATQYLKRTTSALLRDKFKPVIQNSLNKVEATKYYTEIINRYNQLPLVQKANPQLDEYATTKAIDGLFLMIAQEERTIRQNPAARTTELLKKVFAAK
jgi:hypothetical protein